MGTFAAGQIVLVRFPFSDLSASKWRPALFLAEAGRGDWILCQITSKEYGDSRAIALSSSDFASGSLNQSSFVRPAKLFTAHVSLIANVVAELKPDVAVMIRKQVAQLIQS
jgi:mRNA interferase MazF